MEVMFLQYNAKMLELVSGLVQAAAQEQFW